MEKSEEKVVRLAIKLLNENNNYVDKTSEVIVLLECLVDGDDEDGHS